MALISGLELAAIGYVIWDVPPGSARLRQIALMFSKQTLLYFTFAPGGNTIYPNNDYLISPTFSGAGNPQRGVSTLRTRTQWRISSTGP